MCWGWVCTYIIRIEPPLENDRTIALDTKLTGKPRVVCRVDFVWTGHHFQHRMAGLLRYRDRRRHTDHHHCQVSRFLPLPAASCRRRRLRNIVFAASR